MTRELQRLDLMQVVTACGTSDTKWIHDRPEGLRLSLLDNGCVEVSRDGHPTKVLFPYVLKSAEARVPEEQTAATKPAAPKRRRGRPSKAVRAG